MGIVLASVCGALAVIRLAFWVLKLDRRIAALETEGKKP
jgi:hypothetical protein